MAAPDKPVRAEGPLATHSRASLPALATRPRHRLPAESRASRKISFRSRTSVRGMIPVWIPAQGLHRCVCFESKLELIFITLAMTSGKVVDLLEQPPAVKYRDARGKERAHTFDFLITMHDGQRHAVAVRPEARATSRRFDAELALIGSQLPPDFAEDVILFTDSCISTADAINAMRYFDLLKHADPEADTTIQDAIRSLSRPVSMSDLCAATGLAGRAYRAAFRAVMSGFLRQVSPGLIDLNTMVAKGGAA